MWKKWFSRKLLATLGGMITALLVHQLGFPPESAQQISESIMVILCSYLLGQSAVDVAGLLKKPISGEDHREPTTERN